MVFLQERALMPGTPVVLRRIGELTEPTRREAFSSCLKYAD